MLPQTVIPVPHEEERLHEVGGYDVIKAYRQRYEEEHAGERWFEDTEGWYHDPQWRERTMSIQCARDTIEFKSFNPLWLTVGALWIVAQFWLPLYNFFLR